MFLGVWTGIWDLGFGRFLFYGKHVDFHRSRGGRTSIGTRMVTRVTMMKTLARNIRTMRLYCDMVILVNHPKFRNYSDLPGPIHFGLRSGSP